MFEFGLIIIEFSINTLVEITNDTFASGATVDTIRISVIIVNYVAVIELGDRPVNQSLTSALDNETIIDYVNTVGSELLDTIFCNLFVVEQINRISYLEVC